MPTISNSMPERVSGPLAREAAKRKPSMCTNQEQFEAVGEKWCTRYEEDRVPVKLSTPDVMAGRYTESDMRRMLDADMIRRQKRWQARMAVREALAKCPIEREGDD